MASDEYGMASFGADFDRKDGNKVAGIGFGLLKSAISRVFLIQVARGLILRLLFGISHPREHALRCSPGDLARGIEAPHGITGFFKFPQDFGQQLRFSAIIAIVRSSVALAVYPDSQSF
jgi:hypothetical protein